MLTLLEAHVDLFRRGEAWMGVDTWFLGAVTVVTEAAVEGAFQDERIEETMRTERTQAVQLQTRERHDVRVPRERRSWPSPPLIVFRHEDNPAQRDSRLAPVIEPQSGSGGWIPG